MHGKKFVDNLQSLSSSLDIAAIFLDRSFRIRLFSSTARDMFNLIPADNGRLLADITSRLGDDNVLRDAEQVLDKLLPLEREIRTKDGLIYTMWILPYRTEDDRVDGLMLTVFGISDRKMPGEVLKHSESSLRLLIESAKDYAIFTLDMERKVKAWNSGAELILGYKEAEIIDQSGDIFFIPEDREKKAPERETEKARNEGMAENERWHLRKNGTRFYGSGTVRPLLGVGGDLVGYVKIMRDMTVQKRNEDAVRESEERLRVTMDSATDYAIITLDTNGCIIGWSKGAELTFGYEEKEVEGKHTDIIFTPEDRQAGMAEKKMKEARKAGRALDERWHMRKDGARFFMSGVMQTTMNSGGVAGFVKVARDMTERKLLEQQKDEFIGIASHELKTPVTSIKLFAEALEERFKNAGDDQNRGLMQKLNTQVDRLTALIKDLLETTRIVEGQLPLKKEEFDLNMLVETQVEELQRISSRHRLAFNAGSVRLVVADKERITQVLTNIISNAIKYSPNGGDVTITSSTTAEGAKVSVQDLGIGIPKDLQSKVFSRFFRVGNPAVSTYPGMGLGLYISAGIIQRHGGTIWVESSKGGGTVFSFIIPYSNTETN